MCWGVRGTAPKGHPAAPENSSFWPQSATNVADCGQKEKILEG